MRAFDLLPYDHYILISWYIYQLMKWLLSGIQVENAEVSFSMHFCYAIDVGIYTYINGVEKCAPAREMARTTTVLRISGASGRNSS